MKRLAIAFLIGGSLGVGLGFAAGIFIYPYIFLADIVAQEKIENAEAKTIVAVGKFIHANPSDPIHYGKGSVTVYDDVIHLSSDFEVGPGPKFHVYLVPLETVTPTTEVTKTMYVDLGRLRAFKGSQIYPIPDGLDLRKYRSVIIWCEHFSVLISPARLEFEA